MQGGFVCLGIIFECVNPTYNPSYVGGLSLLIHSSGLPTLVHVSFHEKLCKGVDQPWFCLFGATTSHITEVNKYSTIKNIHLHHPMSSLCFYHADYQFPLPIKSLTSVLKASKISGQLLLKHSHHPLVSSCPPKLQTGSWEVEKAVNETKQDIKLQQMSGYHHQGRHGIGYRTPPKPLKKSLPNATETLYLGPSKTSKRLIKFKGSSTSTPGTVDKGVELHPAEFLVKVFACVTSQPYLVLSLFNF